MEAGIHIEENPESFRSEVSQIHDQEGAKFGDFLASIVAGQEHSGDKDSQFSRDVEQAILHAKISREDRDNYQNLRKRLFSFREPVQFTQKDIDFLNSFFEKMHIAYSFMLGQGYADEQLQYH